MYNYRKTGSEVNTLFRTSRFIQNGGEWFFFTREGTMEGPFAFKHKAEERLEIYKRVMSSGFMPLDSELAIQPLDVPNSR
jgi:hypothetical protein